MGGTANKKDLYIYIYGFFPKELSTRSIDMFGSKMVKHLNAVNNVGHGGYLKKRVQTQSFVRNNTGRKCYLCAVCWINMSRMECQQRYEFKYCLPY